MWRAERGNAPIPEEISKHGLLKSVRRLPDGLAFAVDYKGVVCTTTITPRISEDNLILLRHVLIQYWGQPMEVVEAIDIDFEKRWSCLISNESIGK